RRPRASLDRAIRRDARGHAGGSAFGGRRRPERDPRRTGGAVRRNRRRQFRQSRTSGMSTPKARVLHAMPGRVRLRLSAEEATGPRAAAYLAAIGHALVKSPLVIAVSPRPLTGSLVIRHHAKFEDVARFARERGLFDAGRAAAVPKTIMGQI